MPLAFHNLAAEADAGRRAHPWTRSDQDEAWVYVDFKENLSAIRSSVEDLRPFAGKRFAEELYGLIEWLNGPGRIFETNDFAFRGPRPHTDYHNAWPLRCDGRLMFLFRELERNCIRDEVYAARDFLIRALNEQPPLPRSLVGLSLHPTTYSQLSADPKLGADGLQFQFSFFAYGNSGANCFSAMAELARAVRLGMLAANRLLAGRGWLTE